MCTKRLIELRVAWQNSKSVSCKMHAFLHNAISFHCYIVVLYKPIFKLYICKNPTEGLRVLQDTGIEKPDYIYSWHFNSFCVSLMLSQTKSSCPLEFEITGN